MPRYDQHFLWSEGLIKRIIEAVRPLPEETLLEVGPGHGALTRYLLAMPVPYLGIEIDPRCLEQLRQLPHAEKAEWIQGDFIRLALPQKPLYFVSNLPYSISGPAIFQILAHRDWIREGVLMLQAEVAQRLYAVPGTRAYGRVSVLFQSIYGVKRLLRVPPGAFRPPPKVWSEVIRFTRAPKLPSDKWESFAQVVRQAFQQPRQTLSKNLRARAITLPSEWASLRPHQLPVEAYIQIWQNAL